MMLSRTGWAILLLIAALVGIAYVVGARPRPIARTGGRVVALLADAQGLL
jgi:hypothetical protein